MTTITKVALAGAGGNLGPSILQALLNAHFQVTVLSRQSSNSTFPDSVTVKRVDFSSVESLTTALQGIEAVVSTIGSESIAAQLPLIEAAAKVGVKRFIPSDFGSDTYNPLSRATPVFQPKVQTQEKLKELGVPYTVIINGPFLDWGINVGFLLNAKEKSVRLWDGGERTWSTTTLASIGKAAAGALQHLDQTKDKVLYVESKSLSLKRLTALAKEVVGSEGWKEEVVQVADAKKAAEEELKKEKPGPMGFINYVTVAVYGEGYGGRFERTDNELLGIKEISDEEIKGIIRGAASK